MPDVIESTLHEAYAFTHNLLFYYNFGVNIPGLDYKRIESDIEDVIIKLVLRYTFEKNFDIVFELIYVAALHQQLPKWLLHFVFCCLEKNNQSINIRGPINPNPDDLKERSSEYIEWAENYHTTLVASSMFRYLINNWNVFDKYSTTKHLDLPPDHFKKLYQVGSAYSALSEYELPIGAYRTSAIQKDSDSIINHYIKDCVDFIAFQRKSDGTFGYWPDEEILYYRNGGSQDDFNQEIITPISKLCLQALEGNP